MGIALGAPGLGSHHAVFRIPMLGYAAAVDGLVKARPSRAGIELRVGIEQRSAAAHAVIHPRLMIVPVRSGKGALRAGLARHMVLLGRQLLLPVGFRFANFLFGLSLFDHDLLLFSDNHWMFLNAKSDSKCGLHTCSPTFRYFPRKNRSGSPSRTTTSSTSAMKIVSSRA